LFPYIFSTRCLSGASYEVGSAEDADMILQKGIMPFWRSLA
jgi:hypothetical protein